MDKKQEDKDLVSIPYVVYRDAMTHNRWIVNGLIIALLVSVILLFTSNAIWVHYWNQYDYSTEDVTTVVDTEGDGIANYTGGNGGVIYGESDGAQNQENPNEIDG